MIIAAVEANFADSGSLTDSRNMLVHITGVLLLYMTPGEVYSSIMELLRSTKEKCESEEIKSMIRWHIPLNSEDRSRLHMAFGSSYLMTTVRKKRSLAAYMSSIGFEFRSYSAQSFDSLCSRFLPLFIETDMILMYLVEGVKILFRYSYAVLKI
jgi:hypothetical protein